MEEKANLDAFMQGLKSGDVVFIDEVHELRHLESFFHVLHETGAPRYPLRDGRWVEVPADVCWLAATTNPGELDRTVGGAMRRRLEPEIRLESPTPEVLAQILQDQGKVGGQGRAPIHPDAAYEIALRSVGLPWQALLIYEKAVKVAELENGTAAIEVGPGHASGAFSLMGLDENGLLPEDREVIRLLINNPHTLASGRVVYRMSEEALCAAAGLDRATYKRRVQPKLLRTGLLAVEGGQSLTARALQEYPAGVSLAGHHLAQ